MDRKIKLHSSTIYYYVDKDEITITGIKADDGSMHDVIYNALNNHDKIIFDQISQTNQDLCIAESKKPWWTK